MGHYFAFENRSSGHPLSAFAFPFAVSIPADPLTATCICRPAPRRLLPVGARNIPMVPPSDFRGKEERGLVWEGEGWVGGPGLPPRPLSSLL